MSRSGFHYYKLHEWMSDQFDISPDAKFLFVKDSSCLDIMKLDSDAVICFKNKFDRADIIGFYLPNVSISKDLNGEYMNICHTKKLKLSELPFEILELR